MIATNGYLLLTKVEKSSILRRRGRKTIRNKTEILFYVIYIYMQWNIMNFTKVVKNNLKQKIKPCVS